jgi:hypothetical protein
MLLLLLCYTVCDNFGFRFFLKWKVVCFWVLSMQVILINGQFPGPRLDVVTNDNIILNLFNKLDQPFLLTWWVVFLLSLHFLNESSLGLTTTLSSFFSFFDMFQLWRHKLYLHCSWIFDSESIAY